MNIKRLSASTIFVIIGLCLIISGFVYFAIFIGIPYHDATPAQIIQENFHSSISNNIMLIGGIVLVIGLVWSLAKFVIKLVKKK